MRVHELRSSVLEEGRERGLSGVRIPAGHLVAGDKHFRDKQVLD